MTEFLHRTVNFLVRAMLLVAGILITLTLLSIGFVVGLVAVAAALLSGRRPNLQTGFRMPTGRGGWQRFRTPPAGRAARGEVIDAEVREVSAPAPASAERH